MGNLRDKYTDEEWDNLLKDVEKTGLNGESIQRFLTFNEIPSNLYSSKMDVLNNIKTKVGKGSSSQNKEEQKGVKLSQDKPPMGMLLKQFPLALKGVSERSQFGHLKYVENDKDWLNFTRVPNAEEEYLNATIRHLAGIGEENKIEHLKAACWNILALLQITLEKNK